MREDIKRDRPRAPHERAATGVRAEGVRWLVEDLVGGEVRVLLAFDDGRIVVHSGPVASVRSRCAIDAAHEDRAEVDSALASVPVMRKP